jgi:hypothetical protein
MDCPKCGLTNAETAQRCACGYIFAAEGVKELETYKGNRGFMALAVLPGLIPALMLIVAFTDHHFHPTVALVALLLFAGPVLHFLWLMSIRVTLHKDGISYHTLFGEKELRWDAVDRFYYGATKRSANFKWMGIDYHFNFVDAEGRKLSFGNRVRKTGKLGQKLIDLSYPALFKKVAEQFNSGQEVDFGPIRLSRTGGVKKMIFLRRYKEIPWNQFAGWSIQQGHFYIFCVGEKSENAAHYPVGDVPNAFVLNGLLNSICKRSAAA